MQLISLQSQSLIRCHGRFLTGNETTSSYSPDSVELIIAFASRSPKYISSALSYIHTYQSDTPRVPSSNPQSFALYSLGVFLHWLLSFRQGFHSYYDNDEGGALFCFSIKVHSIPIIH